MCVYVGESGDRGAAGVSSSPRFTRPVENEIWGYVSFGKDSLSHGFPNSVEELELR